MIQKIKGTMDIMPEEAPLWRYIEGVMREEAARFGYGEIRTPTFENTELFVRGVGDTTDVVQKEMYTFADRDESRSISLKPEGTASVVRAIIENGRCGGAMPLKYYYITNCFRHEKPQAGRSREFVQFGTEMFGSESPLSDATAIALAHSVLVRLGLGDKVRLNLNSIGCKNCRPNYRAALVDYFRKNEQRLCPTCKDRLEKNPLRLLDCKVEACHAIAINAPKTVDNLCPECEEKFTFLCNALDAMGIEYTVNPSIVRGLDYYTGAVFEFISEGIGAQSTVCGGGRYDGLVESLGGPALSGIGFGMGITRIILAMQAAGTVPTLTEVPDIYVAPLGRAAQLLALSITHKLRGEGYYAECDIVERSLKAQMKYAGKIGARYALIIGENEVNEGMATLRDMQTGLEKRVLLSGFTLE